MATKSANVYARIEPDVKEQAEGILAALGAGDGGMGPKSGLDTADEYVNPKQRYDTGYPRRCGYLQDVFPR